MAQTMVTTHRSWSDSSIAQDTSIVPASMAATVTAATTAGDKATERLRSNRGTTAPASPAPTAPMAA
ncbi:hypothetical protein ACWEP4_22865 [Streptomyces sp. NPDC004227]